MAFVSKRQSLDVLDLKNPPLSKRYFTSIPEARITNYDQTQIPVLRNKADSVKLRQIDGSGVLSARTIDNRLRSISTTKRQSITPLNNTHVNQEEASNYNETNTVRMTLEQDKKDRTNLKFLRYKFNPNEEPSQNLMTRKVDPTSYGQWKRQGQNVTINMLFDSNSVFYEDTRVPAIYKRHFMSSQNYS